MIADRRLVEYFVIVSSIEQLQQSSEQFNDANSNTSGSGKKNSSSHHNKQRSNGDISFSDWKTESSYEQDEDDVFSAYQFKPTITARYPLHDHPDNPLHDNVTFFCHPSGGIQLRTEEYMPKVCTYYASSILLLTMDRVFCAWRFDSLLVAIF